MPTKGARHTDAEQVRRALALLHSIILTRELLSPKAQAEYEAALVALDRLKTARG